MPWSRDDITRLIEVEAQLQGVDPRLAVAVAQQESALDPNNPGDNGASRGVFHLQRKAAMDAGIDPARRDDPATGIFGGVKYLKQQLDRSKGHIPTALSYYNRGTPDYRGIGDPDYIYHVMRHYPEHPLGKAPEDQAAYRARLNQTFGRGTAPAEPSRQQPGIMARVSTALSPASAEAATPQAAPRSRLEEIEAELARREGQATPQAAPVTQASPPTATSTPEQDAAYRAARGQPATPDAAPLSQTAPTTQTPPGASQGPPAPDTSWTPGMRFQALPSIQQLEPGDRAQKTKLFESLDPQSQQEFLRSEEPASTLVVDIEKPSTPQAARVAAGPPGVLPVPPPDQPLTEGFTKPSTMIPLLTGVGIPGRMAAAPALRGANQLVEASGLGSWAGKFVRPVVEGLSQTLGFGIGRTMETGTLPSPGELATEFAVTAGTGRLLEDLGSIGADFLRRSKGGQAIINADKLTQDAHAKWQADTQAAEEAAKSEQKALYDTAVIKAKTSQREYEMATRQRRETIDANKADYDEALRVQQADDLAREQARTQKMTQRQEEYTGAIQRQEAALTQARAIPKQYAPETPSWVLYETYGDAAKDTVLDLAPGQSALAELRAQRGVLPDGTVRPFPKAVEDIVANLEKATGPVPFETIRQEIRKLGPLTRSPDGNIRGPAKQAMGVIADVLDTAPGTNDLLKQANANFRREMAVKDMDEWLKTGHGIVSRDRYNREKIDVAKLFTKLDTTMSDDAMFRGSFAPDERQAIRAGFGTLAGTPNMPRQPPRDLAPIRPGTPPELRPDPPPVTLPGDVPVKQVPLPRGEGDTGIWPTLDLPGAPERITQYDALGPRPRPAPGALARLGGLEYLASMVGIPPGVVTAVKTIVPGTQQARWLFAHGLMDTRRRQMMQAAINGEGILNPQFYSVMLASLSPAERKAFERETGAAAQRGEESARAPGGAARQTD